MTACAPFDMTRFRLIPLGPIHVGGGEEATLYPDEYRIHDGRIELISARAVLASMPQDAQARWLRDMARAPEGTLARLLEQADARHVTGTITLGPESRRELGRGGRRGDLRAFQRAGGQPILPGSSLKGALRTAWLAILARKQGIRTDDYEKLEQRAFKLRDGQHATDTDPFRDVLVRDAVLPEGATRIDQVHTWKRAGDSWDFTSVGQLHVERLRAVTDGGAPPLIDIEIGLLRRDLRQRRAAFDPRHERTPTRTPPDMRYLLLALEAHHAPLWKREMDKKFLAGDAGQRMRATLALFSHLRRGGDDPDAALVRLGWAAHAEAKSVAGLRQIKRPQAKGAGKVAAEGSTRHVLSIDGHPAPFGWALLVRADRWQAPAAWLKPPAARPMPTGTAGKGGGMRPGNRATPQRALAGQVKWPKGTRVRLSDGTEGVLDEDVTEAMRDEVMVMIEGSPEPVNVSEIEGEA